MTKNYVEVWNRRKVVLLHKIDLVLESYSHRRGRKPKDVSYWELILEDDQARRNLSVRDFLRIESRINHFWEEII